mmetsp:Transcript_37691/g.118985  ORF Transcript_37691/g.118985 Transcript_37691/m.118985 type:complete len:239 (-) Transcript_37691:2147-2863(-)
MPMVSMASLRLATFTLIKALAFALSAVATTSFRTRPRTLIARWTGTVLPVSVRRRRIPCPRGLKAHGASMPRPRRRLSSRRKREMSASRTAPRTSWTPHARTAPALTSRSSPLIPTSSSPPKSPPSSLPSPRPALATRCSAARPYSTRSPPAMTTCVSRSRSTPSPTSAATTSRSARAAQLQMPRAARATGACPSASTTGISVKVPRTPPTSPVSARATSFLRLARASRSPATSNGAP